MTGPYQQQSLGAALSTVVATDDTQDEAMRSMERGSSEPTIKPAGLLWWCSNGTILSSVGVGVPSAVQTDGMALLRWNGSAWKYVCPEQPLLDAAGKQKWLGTIDANGQQLDNLPFPATDDAPWRKGDVVRTIYPCSHWYQTNRDTLANSKPIVVQQEASQDATYTEVERVPRRLRIRLTGEFRAQSGNALWGSSGDIQANGLEFEVYRWNAQTAGGDAGTEGSILAATITHVGSGRKVDIYVEWKYAEGPPGEEDTLGFYLRFIGGGSGFTTTWLNIKKIGDSGTDGVVQAQAWYGEGT